MNRELRNQRLQLVMKPSLLNDLKDIVEIDEEKSVNDLINRLLSEYVDGQKTVEYGKAQFTDMNDLSECTIAPWDESNILYRIDKELDQAIKADKGKLEISLVPMEIVRNIASIRMYGNKKYPKNTWRQVEVERYIDAMDRHVLLFNDNPYGVDEESGLPHLWHIACNVAFLCELMKGKYDDSEKR